VRIDNSGNGVHQIIKRKKTKEGNVLVSANSQLIDEDECFQSPQPGKIQEEADLNQLTESLDPNS